jgi:nitroreductase
MDVWEAIRTKRAIRVFTDQPLPEEAVRRIIDAGRRAQSSKNTQPWHFIAVRDRQRLKELSQLGDFMGHVAGAALCVAIITPDPTIRFSVMFDAGQSAAYMQLAAQEMGIGSCLGTVYQPDAARELLRFPAEMHARIVISFGYPAPQQRRPGVAQAGRRPFDDVVHWETW